MTDTPRLSKYLALDSTQINLDSTLDPTLTQTQKFSSILGPWLAEPESITLTVNPTKTTNNLENFFDCTQPNQSEQDQARATMKFLYKSFFVAFYWTLLILFIIFCGQILLAYKDALDTAKWEQKQDYIHG